MMNRIRKYFGFTALLCILLCVAFAVPAFAASYSRMYGTTMDRIRVRESASSSAATIDNLVKDRCVYIIQSKDSGGITWIEVRYRSHEGGTETGWVAQTDGKTTYVKVLSATQAKSLYNVSDGNIPNKVAGAWTAKERAAAKNSGSSSSSSSSGSSSSSDTVKRAQTILKNLGIYSGEITGSIGNKTTAAIKEFQKRYSLKVDGALGPETIAKLNSVGGSSASSSSSSSSSTSTENIKRAQVILKDLGIYSGEVTGRAGTKTTAAIKEFQKRNGLTVDGVLGSATMERLNAVAGTSSSSSSGVSSDTIKDVQAKLKNMGIYSGEVTGTAGSKTTAAIKEFQKRYNLTVDGVAGPATVAKLNQVYSNASTVKVNSTSSTGLGLGSSGSAVRQLQENLTALGYYWADVTGNFGSKTQAAVKSFQKAYGLPQDGVAGSTTLTAINTALSKKGISSSSSSSSSGTISTSGYLQLNSSGSDVTALQTKLKALGLYSGEITGHYGEKTRDAVLAFQSKNGLTADGIAGPATLKAINNAKVSSSSSSSSSTSTGSSSISSSTLAVGSTGSAVSSLQTNLTTLGYYNGDITGHYGSMTAEAVRKYQKAKGLSQTGTASQSLQTRIANETGSNTSKSTATVKTSLKEGDSGSAVTALQNALYKLGFYSGTISGNYGSLTAAAVRRFQEKNNLTVDGIAGSKTIALINSKAGTSISANSGSTSSSTSNSSTTLTSYARVSKTSAILRSEASTSSKAQVTLRNGIQMKIDKRVVKNGDTWYHVEAYQDGYSYRGYVRSDLVTVISYSDFKANSNNNSGSDDEVQGVLQVTSSDVAVREGPSTSDEIIRRAQYGDIYTYTDVSGGWYKLSDGSYINGSYVTTNVDSSKLSDGDQTSYRYDDTGAMVTTIQEYLKKLGYYNGDVTGHYGTKTVEAVQDFQSDNGLTADGIAGPKTIAALQSKIAGSGGSISVSGVVYNINWFSVKGTSGAFSTLGLVANQYGYLTDLTTGIRLRIKIQSTGNHADAEPVSASDTAKFCSIYGVANASSITSNKHYGRRPMLLETDKGYKAVCSMYGVPHGKSTISDNNYPGQFCLHFLNSKTSGTDKVDAGHQTAITKAIALVKSNGATVTTLNGAP